MNQNRQRRSQKLLFAGVAVAALTLGVAVSYVTSRQSVPEIDGLLWPGSKALAAVSLEDHRREPFTLEQLKGRWTLLFFGYTHCPDVCPITLSVLKNAVADMPTDADAPVQVVFVSVDPARDTPEHLAAYVTYFDPEFVGVTGIDANLKSFARQLGVLYVLGEPDANGSYLVDHTAAVFLIDPRGHLVALFHAPHVPETFVRDLPRIQDVEWN